MKTLAISLIEKKPHRDGGTYDHLKSLEVFLVKNEARTILLQDIILQSKFPVLLQIQNHQLTTLLDCTGVTRYEIFYFDATFQFTGKAYSLNEGSGTFQIQTQAKWVLFVHLESKECKDLQDFNCSELDIIDKYHIIKRAFPFGYGVFPYLIVKHEKSVCFSQIPIYINPTEENLPGWSIIMETSDVGDETLLENNLVEATKDYYQNLCEKHNNIIKMALVLGHNKAYYYASENKVNFNESIPSGGVVLDISGQIIAKNTRHYLE
jgi:hypothetical protein